MAKPITETLRMLQGNALNAEAGEQLVAQRQAVGPALGRGRVDAAALIDEIRAGLGGVPLRMGSCT